MAAFQSPAFRAIASQLAQALETYQQHVDAMVESWMDWHLYGSVSRELDGIRHMRKALPAVSIEMVDVLVRHVELTCAIWETRVHRSGIPQGGELQRLRERHHAAVQAMREKCLKIASDR